MTELTHLLGCELTPVEKSLIGFGESRGSRLERERIIKLLENYTGCRDEYCGGYCECLRAEWVIDLIKGEPK